MSSAQGTGAMLKASAENTKGKMSLVRANNLSSLSFQHDAKEIRRGKHVFVNPLSESCLKS